EKKAFVKDKEYDAESGQEIEFRRLRGTGLYRDPNDICLLLSMGLFIALYSLTDAAQGALRLLWIAPAGFFLYALSLTASRGGMLNMVAGFFALFYARFGWRGTLMLGVPLVLVALAIFGGRMASFSASEGTGATRVEIWSDALEAMRESPIFGLGAEELAL